jgi:hypothetical protein
MDASSWFCQRSEGRAHGFNLDKRPSAFAEPPFRWPDITTLDLDRIGPNSYEAYDLLSTCFGRHPVPAVNSPLDAPDSEFGYSEARIGITTGRIVGIDITGQRKEELLLHAFWASLPEPDRLAKC